MVGRTPRLTTDSASLLGARLLEDQRYDVVDAVEVDGLVVFRLTWWAPWRRTWGTSAPASS